MPPLRFSPRWLSLYVVVYAALGIAAPAQASNDRIYTYWSTPAGQPAITNEWYPGSAVTYGAAPDLRPTETPQWLHDDQPIPGADSPSLTLPNLSAADAGNYRLRATDGAQVRYSNTIVINVLPATTPTVVDTSFSSQLPVSFKVARVTAFAADGSVIAIPTDSTTPPVRLAADGSLVAGFNYPLSAGDILAGFPDGRLITANAPYLLAADGSPLPLNLPAAFDGAQPLTSAGVADDGSFYLSQGTTLVHLRADGTLDSTFNYTPSLDSVTSVTIFALTANGVLVYENGLFGYDGYVYYMTKRLSRLDASGHRDTTFPSFTTRSDATEGYVLLADGRLLHWRLSKSERYELNVYSTEDISANAPTTVIYVMNSHPLVVDPDRAFLYTNPGNGPLQRYTINATTIDKDVSFFSGSIAGEYADHLAVTPAGQLLVPTSATKWEGRIAHNLVRLRTDVPRPLLPPAITISTPTTTPRRGDTVTLTVTTSDAGPYTYQWLALDGQALPTTTTSSSLTIPNFSAQNFGRYQLRVSGAFGSALSSVIELSLSDSTDNLPYLANLSGRAVPGSGEDTVIAGFTTKNSSGLYGVPLLIRGVGPGLKNLGVANYLPNPSLNLTNLAGTVIANNDNWSTSADRDTIRTDFSATGAFALADDSLDAAFLKTSYNEQFTIQLFDQGDATASGVGLLEIYRVPAELVAGELTNLSFRARTGPGDAVAIAGFVIVDPQNFGRSARVLLRVVGPKLADLGIQHPLADPVLTLYNSKGEVVRRVDNWSDDADPAALAATMSQVGAFTLSSNSKDAAVVLDLPAGAYSLHATGGEGVVLLEIYLVR